MTEAQKTQWRTSVERPDSIAADEQQMPCADLIAAGWNDGAVQ